MQDTKFRMKMVVIMIDNQPKSVIWHNSKLWVNGQPSTTALSHNRRTRLVPQPISIQQASQVRGAPAPTRTPDTTSVNSTDQETTMEEDQLDCDFINDS
jgi:hypothetical protein